jgi:hypothetical protein
MKDKTMMTNIQNLILQLQMFYHLFFSNLFYVLRLGNIVKKVDQGNTVLNRHLLDKSIELLHLFWGNYNVLHVICV